MHVISRKRLQAFARLHPDCEAALDYWFRIMKRAEFSSIQDVRRFFPHADLQGKQLTIFNVGGNKCRLITAIHYNTKTVYIRHVLTHSEYSQGRWS